MIPPLQRLGNYSMFIGSILHITVPHQYKMSILILIVGSILCFRYDNHDYDIFSKSLGLNMLVIGVAYELHSFRTPKSYSSCVFGGFLVMGGYVSLFLKNGKPPQLYVTLITWSAFVFHLSSAWKFYLNIFQESPPTIVSGTPGGIGNAFIDLSLGFFHLLDGMILQFIVDKRANETNEIRFRSRNYLSLMF